MKLLKALNFLQNHIRVLLIIYFLIQFCYVLFSNLTYQSDSLYYFSLAQECLKLHTFYPAPIHLYQDYITAPLYINVLVVLLSVYNSPFTIGLFNILLNFIQLWLVYEITGKLFGKRAGSCLVVIYIFYLSTLGLILFNYTEYLFNVLVFASIYFYLQKKNYSLFLSGVLLAASIAVRPIGWALLAAYLIIVFFKREKFKMIFASIILIFSGMLLFILSFGLFNYSHFGRFIFTSTNGPVNLLIGANNDATGAYNNKVFEIGKIGYLPDAESKTYIDKEDFWFGQVSKWIFNNPLKYISLFPLKIVHIFIWDDFSVSRLLNLEDWNLYRVMKNILEGNYKQILDNKSYITKISYFILLIIHHLYYFSIVVIFFFISKNNIREIIRNYKLGLFILFMILGVAIHLLTFGDARFKYPYIIMMMIFISPVTYQTTISKKLNCKYKSLAN